MTFVNTQSTALAFTPFSEPSIDDASKVRKNKVHVDGFAKNAFNVSLTPQRLLSIAISRNEHIQARC